MSTFDPIRYKAATAVFKLATKTFDTGVHRTLNRPPKGKGWMPCSMGPEGLMIKPGKVKEAIAYFKIAYEVFPDIVALNQIALGFEMLGDKQVATDYFQRIKAQAETEGNDAYAKAAELGLRRCDSQA